MNQTSSILLSKVRKSPDVTESNGVADRGQDEGDLRIPEKCEKLKTDFCNFFAFCGSVGLREVICKALKGLPICKVATHPTSARLMF